MATAPTPKRGMPDALAARLLREMGKVPGQEGSASAAAAGVGAVAPDGLSPAAFAALYRETISALEERGALGDGHAPMLQHEVELLVRCVLSAADLEEAMRLAIQYCAMLYPRAGELGLELAGDSALFRMDSLRRQRSVAACLVDITGVYSYLILFSWLIGEALRPSEVLLAHLSRDDAGPFLGLFAAPVVMGQPTCGFYFDAALLARPVVRQASELPAFLKYFSFDVSAGPGGRAPLTQRVSAHFEAALAERLPLPGGAALASLLNVSESSLRRQLQVEGSSLSALRDACLRSAAERLLRQTELGVEGVAERLGFSDAGAFRRAFNRWTGAAPSGVRRGIA